MTTTDPLESLLVDADAVDRAALAEGLRDIVRLDRNSGRLAFQARFGQLDAKRKILAVLLATKTRTLLGISQTDSLSASELIAETGLKDGTVHPTLKRLRESKTVMQDNTGRYFVSNPQLQAAINELS